MRIQRVTVKRYKNLKAFDCVFSDSNIAAFIGNNGSGKSNLLEVITRAFSNAKNYASNKELPIIPPHTLPMVNNCVIEYEIGGSNYVLSYNADVDGMLSRLEADPPVIVREEISICCNGTKLQKSEMTSALPDSILLYYAGETLRQKGTAEGTYDNYYERELKRTKTADLPSLRFMDYFSAGDLPLLLLTASAYKGEYYSRFLNLIGCSDISSKFSFILRNPGKGKGAADTYWNATGFVKHFLNETRRYVSGTRDSGGFQYYMFFDNAEDLKNISNDEYDLFAKLRALKHYGYLEHIGIELQKCDGTPFSSLRLSEGEKQLGLLFLLTAFTAHHDCVYLFDEFDAYLHLNWQRLFSQMLRETDTKGQIILTTHSASSISKLQCDELLIMKNGTVEYPDSETYNRALDEIMLEQMGVTMHSPEIEKRYDDFKQFIANRNREGALRIMQEMEKELNAADPLLSRMRLNLRRI